VARTLIEYWDTTTWTVASSPNPGSTGNQLNAVSVVFDSDAWAVGFFTDDSFIAHTLIEHWDGFSWNVVPSPDSGSNGSYLQGVSVYSSDDVWAVGYYVDDNQADQTLIEHWDGKSWAIVTSPNRGTDGSQLNSVTTATSRSDVWAVGYSGQGSSVVTLTEHWDGFTWSIVDSPNPGTSGNYLQSVSMVLDGSAVWAVGYYYLSGHPRTLIEQWNGGSWNVIPSPNVGTIGDSLFGVSGLFANDVWAVGGYNLNNQTGTLQTLIEHWDGGSWNVAPSPNQGAADNVLYGITYYPNNGWSVGTFSDGVNGETLNLQYYDPCPTPTATPTETCVVLFADCGSILSIPPTDFTVGPSCPIDFCEADGFTVNNVPADSCTTDIEKVTFHFNSSPAVPGLNTIHVDGAAFSCCGRSVDEFTCTFRYEPPTPSPTQTPSPTPTPATTATATSTPRSTAEPRPRPTPHPRP
jgi:hypothetical protein